jgi:predicted esterase
MTVTTKATSSSAEPSSSSAGKVATSKDSRDKVASKSITKTTKKNKMIRELTKKEKEEGFGVFKMPRSLSWLDEGSILEPYGEHTHTLVYLHHLDCDEHVLVQNKWWYNGIKGLRCVFPAAPFHKSDYYEETLQSWFDYKSNHHNDMSDVPETVDRIVKILQEECELLSPDRVFFGGYSQGAAFAFHCLMDPRLPPLGGFVSTSGTIMHQTQFCKNQQHTPIVFDIPSLDSIYPASRTVRLVKSLAAKGFTGVQRNYHKNLKHEAYQQRCWVQRFLGDVMSRTRPRAA